MYLDVLLVLAYYLFTMAIHLEVLYVAIALYFYNSYILYILIMYGFAM